MLKGDNLVIAYCTRGTMPFQFVNSLLLAQLQVPASVISVRSGPNIDRARNFLVDEFLSSGGSHLLMVDDDMEFTAADCRRVWELSKASGAVVGGLCHSVDERGILPVVYRAHPETHEPERVPDEQIYGQGIVKCDFTGAAFLCIPRSAILKVAEKAGRRWFSYTAKYGTSEDWAFCARLHDAGVKLFVDSTLRIGHIKPRVIYGPEGHCKCESGTAQPAVS